GVAGRGLARGVAGRAAGAPRAREGADASAGRAQRRPPTAADGAGRGGLPLHRTGRRGRPARLVRRPPPARAAALHVRPGVGRAVPQLQRDGRRHRGGRPGAPRPAGHRLRRRVAGAVPAAGGRGVGAGLDVPLVLVGGQQLQPRLPRDPRRVRRPGELQLPRRRRAGRVRLRLDARVRGRAARHQRLPARRRRRVPHLRRPRPRGRGDDARLPPPRPHGAGPAGGLGGAEGAGAGGARGGPGIPEL
ncbi:MAG: hypothetical protein AVDCRST_MAG54-2258, partial [uncultured Actinomycetospora sp.]